jgi:hypothetical protein
MVNSWRIGAGGAGRAYEAFVFCEEDGDAGVDFADGEGDEHGEMVVLGCVDCLGAHVRKSRSPMGGRLCCLRHEYKLKE